MIDVTFGTKVKNYSFDLQKLELTALFKEDYDLILGTKDADGSRTIELDLGGGDSIEVHGLFTKNFSVKWIDEITVYENGKLTFSATGLDITGADIKNAAALTDYLESETYDITGNGYAGRITGGDLADAINGGKGSDILTGGGGRDLFEFLKGTGVDTIMDFDAVGSDHETIDLSHYSGIDSFSDLDISRAGRNVVIELSGSDEIILKNVKIGTVDASDFDF